MSGGSHNYICYKIESDLCGQMYDAELNELMVDIVELAHDLEWADSSDISHESYLETVSKFKNKWFRGSREERLKGYIDKQCSVVKEELYKLIGVDLTEEGEE